MWLWMGMGCVCNVMVRCMVWVWRMDGGGVDARGGDVERRQLAAIAFRASTICLVDHLNDQ